jgi:hypothetical protein
LTDIVTQIVLVGREVGRVVASIEEATTSFESMIVKIKGERK